MDKGLRTQAKRLLLGQVEPDYQAASGANKQQILEDFVKATGYARKYAQWLLNHAEEVLQTPAVLHRRSGPEVEAALVLIWKTLNCICSKRLIPFLPTILDSLEQHGHLELSEESHQQLLSMSAATADRLLRAYRYIRPRGLSTTKAGPWLKEQIPIRTFAQWDETQPGFLEVDLVAHCGGTHRGRLSLHPHPHRHCHGVDRMSPAAQSWARDGACGLAARPHPLPVSHPRDRHG